MTDALRLEVKKDGFSQLQNGSYKLTVTLNPTDLDDNAQDLLLDFIRAGMGTVYMLGMARVDVDTGEIAKPEKPKKRFHEMPYSQQAALRCNDERFSEFMDKATPGAFYDDPAEFVRFRCGVDSRRALDYDAEAAAKWVALNAQYEEWAGLLPEAR